MGKVSYPSGYYVRFSPPSSVVLVTCISRDGRANIITIGMYMPISFDPPLLAIGVSPKRYSHSLIEETGEFVVNVPGGDLVDAAVLCGSVSGRVVDKFKEAKLTAIPASKVKPPLIAECIAHFECRVYDKFTAGDHTIFIGEVVAVSIEEKAVKENVLDVTKTQPISHRGRYYFTPSLFYEAKK